MFCCGLSIDATQERKESIRGKADDDDDETGKNKWHTNVWVMHGDRTNYIKAEHWEKHQIN